MGKIMVVGGILVVILLTILLHLTNPATVGPLGILSVFILIYLLVLGALTFLLLLGSKSMAKLTSSLTPKKPMKALSLRRSYYFSSVISLAPVMFIAMQSVGEVGVYDVILVLLFVIIACVYISKRTM